MNRISKIFLLGLAVVALAGFGKIGTTNAAATPGSLIKMNGLSSVYYLGQDGKRYVFPAQNIYFSWYKDFSGVVTISQSELESYPLGANITMRPGTRLVKITTNPKVYAVEPGGNLRAIPDEATAKALYGDNWNKRVSDVADAFFTNYKMGNQLASNEVPAGSLVKNAGNASVYYFDGTNYRSIANEAAFNANRFSFDNVMTISNTITAGGTAITANEFANPDSSATGIGTIPGQGTGLTVALSASTPASTNVPKNGTRVPFTKVNVTASNDGAINLEAITIKRVGLSNYTDFAGSNGKVWAEKNGIRVSSQKTISSNDEAILTFSPVLNIPAGQTVVLDIVASLNNAEGNAALSIASASAVSANGATISGSFPVVGNSMSFTNYAVAEVEFEGGDGTKSAKVGDVNVELGTFVLSFGAESRDVIFQSVVLKNTGVEDVSQTLSNLTLEKNGEVISSNATVDGRNVTFTIKNDGLLIEKGDSLTFKVRGDIIGKENTGSNGYTFNLNRKEDISISERSTGFGVSIIETDTVMEQVTVTAGALSLTKKSTTPSDTDAIKGSKGVVSLIANVRADEAIVADGMKINFTSVSGATSSFENAKVYVNGYLLGSFDPSTSPAEIDSSVNFNKGDNEVKVTVDVKTDATASHDIKFSLAAGDIMNGQSPEYVASGNSVNTDDINGSPEGAKITVQGASLTMVRNDGYSDGRKIVKGSKDIVLGKFNVKASYDNVKITSVQLTENGHHATTSGEVADSSVYDMKLFVDGVQIGTTRDFNSGATFSSLNYNLIKDQIKTIELVGSFDTANTGYFKTTMKINGEDSRGKAVAEKQADTADLLITNEGTLDVAAGADTVVSSILLAKPAIEQEIGQYRLTAIDDLANITELTFALHASSSAANVVDPRVSSYKLYDGANLVSTDNPISGVTTFRITGNQLTVPANGAKTITLKAVFNTIDNPDQSNVAIRAKLTGYKFKSSAGNETATTTLSVATNLMNLRKTAPTFSPVSGVTGGQGSNQEVFKFTITADSNEDVVLNSLVFTESGSATGTANVSSFKLYEGDVEKGATTTASAPTFTSLNLTIAKGTSKTYTLKADTSAVPVDATYGIALEKGTDGANVSWAEYFVAGTVNGNALYLSHFPLSGSTMKY